MRLTDEGTHVPSGLATDIRSACVRVQRVTSLRNDFVHALWDGEGLEAEAVRIKDAIVGPWPSKVPSRTPAELEDLIGESADLAIGLEAVAIDTSRWRRPRSPDKSDPTIGK
jgi:hypothetical protein